MVLMNLFAGQKGRLRHREQIYEYSEGEDLDELRE